MKCCSNKNNVNGIYYISLSWNKSWQTQTQHKRWPLKYTGCDTSRLRNDRKADVSIQINECANMGCGFAPIRLQNSTPQKKNSDSSNLAQCGIGSRVRRKQNIQNFF